jgi:preprotein translocase subunit YajC
MSLAPIIGLLAMAPAQPGTQANSTGEMIKMFGFMAFMFVIMYFAMIRPGQKAAKQKAELLKTLKRGDKVVTSGGFIGVITSISEKSVSVRSGDSKFEILKSSVTEITERASSES